MKKVKPKIVLRPWLSNAEGKTHSMQALPLYLQRCFKKTPSCFYVSLSQGLLLTVMGFYSAYTMPRAKSHSVVQPLTLIYWTNDFILTRKRLSVVPLPTHTHTPFQDRAQRIASQHQTNSCVSKKVRRVPFSKTLPLLSLTGLDILQSNGKS